jgi:multidrug efflux pump
LNFTDIFIRRPVLASVVSLLILVVGIRSFSSLQVLAYPKTENGIVTVTTSFPGADPDALAGFITTPIEQAVAQANGIDYMTSTSANNTSTITVNLRQNYDTSKAAAEINIKVNSVLNQLPSGALQPAITVKVGQTTDAMYLGFSSKDLQPNQITDYIQRVVQPRLQAIPGVQTAELLGAQYFSLRAWLDPKKLAGYGLTASDVSSALASNDYISAIGNTKGQMVQVTLISTTNLHTLNGFKNLVVKQVGGGVIRLSDLGTVELGADSYDANVAFDGRNGVFVGIQVAPSANLLTVANGVKAIFPDIKAQLPQGLNGEIIYDSTDYVNQSIGEVATTLIEALVIVMLVIFAFLGSPRSVLIPVVAIPLSLVGTFAIMLALGFSINLLTLLALVLAIGLVVDDAIIVVENVNRHLEEGMRPIPAAGLAARELGGPIIAMTVVLLAVFVPIGFQGGLTGALFVEFAFTLAGAVTVSAIIALTLSPMMASRLLKPHLAGSNDWESRLVRGIDKRFDRVRVGYRRRLESVLRYTPVIAVFVVVVLFSIVFLYRSSKSELAPQEDQGFVLLQPTPAPNASLQQKILNDQALFKLITDMLHPQHVFQIDSPAQNISGIALQPLGKLRKMGSNEIQQQLQQKFGSIAGARVAVFQPPSLPGGAIGLPIQFAIQSTDSASRLFEVSSSFLDQARQSGLFAFIDSDLKIDQPQSVIEIDRDKAAQLGLTMNQVGSALGSLLGGNYVNYFSMDTRSYKVIPQVIRVSRLNVDQLLNYPIATIGGVTIPLSSIASIRSETVPESLNHFQQVNAATLSAVTVPGVSLDDGIRKLQQIAKESLPANYTVDYGGQARQFVQESGGIMVTFALAIIIVFLSLAALFESFRDPFVILISVPLSIAGALIFIAIGIHQATINIYTEVGLVTLMGLISKHGILIVEVANAQQELGKSKYDAIVEAAGERLRPILMTTAAMVLGVLPLVFASGAGAASRFAIGLVISTGLSIGTLFTLFVVPGVYMLVGADHSRRTEVESPAAQAPAVPAQGT